jgi:hypothetical protein
MRLNNGSFAFVHDDALADKDLSPFELHARDARARLAIAW